MIFIYYYLKGLLRDFFDNSKQLDDELKEMALNKDERILRVSKKALSDEPYFGVLEERDDVDLIIGTDEPEVVKIQKQALFEEIKGRV